MSDDDIIDLIEIVKPGKEEGAPAVAEEHNFGADLDAILLDDLVSKTTPAAAPLVNKIVAAPIANPTKTEHMVNPDEELELPPLSDLDALLEELGVQDSGADQGASSASRQSAAAAPSAPSSFSSSTVLEDFDETIAPAAASKPVSKAPQVAAQRPVSQAAAGPSPLTTAPASKSAPSQPVSTPSAPGGGPRIVVSSGATPKAARLVVPPSHPAVSKAVPVPSEGVDMNELDTLLDSVLASAPVVAPREGSVPEAVAPAPIASPTANGAVITGLQAEVAALKAENADLREQMGKLAATASEAVIAGLRKEMAELKVANAGLREQMDKLSAVVAAGVTGAEVEAFKAEFTDLRENMDKLAATAAAKVIREEIAALISAGE